MFHMAGSVPSCPGEGYCSSNGPLPSCGAGANGSAATDVWTDLARRSAVFIACASNVRAHFMRCDWRLACPKSWREEGQERPVLVMLQALRTGNRVADELEGCQAVRHEGDLLCL